MLIITLGVGGMKRVRVKNYLLLMIIGLISVLLVGCDVEDVVDNYSQAIIAEGDYNKECIRKLNQVGLIDSETAKELIEHIDKTVAKYTKVSNTSDFSSKSKDSISWVISEKDFKDIVNSRYNQYYRSAYVDEDGKTKFSEPEPSFSKLKSLLDASIKVISYEEWKEASNKSDIATIKIGDPAVKAKSNPKPIPYLAMEEKDIENIQKRSTWKVYVLKSDGYNNEIYSDTYQNKEWYDKKYGDPSYVEYASMDRLLKALDGLKSNVNVAENEKIVNEYFMDSGTTLTVPVNLITTGNISFMSDGVESMRIAVKRFDKNAIESLYGNLENKEPKYIIHGDIAYLLEYPVYYVRDIEAVEDGGSEWRLTTEETNMLVNFYSGEMLDENGKALNESENSDVMYHRDIQTGSTSFMFGTELVTYNEIGYDKITVSNCLQIVLRDYLELIYLPGTVEGESFVAVGRRIRIQNLKGNLNTPLGYFIDKKGNKVGATNVLATDVISILSGQKGDLLDYTNTKIKVALKYKENLFDSTNGTVDGSTDETGLIENTELLLKTRYLQNMRMAYEFPWKGLVGFDDIAGEDVNNTKKKGPQLYAIAIDINLFDSALYSDWINVPGEGGDIGSLEWWNKWLNANNYKYQISIGNLKDVINKNYSYELSKDGYIILDLDTIAKIQKEYDRENEVQRVVGVKTAFIILGSLLIAYAILLPIAWFIDVNMINGPQLLSKLSFGNWVAVSDSAEVPTINVGDKQYYDFRAIITKSLLICGIGVMIYLLDFVEIAGYVWKLFAGLVQKIKEVIFNMF